MMTAPTIVPITDLRQDATGIVKFAASSREPVFITQRGRATAVVVSMEVYQQSRKELELLHLLAKGEQEIAAGIGHDFNDVLDQAAGLLDQS